SPSRLQIREVWQGAVTGASKELVNVSELPAGARDLREGVFRVRFLCQVPLIAEVETPGLVRLGEIVDHGGHVELLGGEDIRVALAPERRAAERESAVWI